MKKDSINELLLPVRVRIEYTWNRETKHNERVCYLECANGEMLTGNLPFAWTGFIASSLNRKYVASISSGQRVSNPIAIIKIEGLPMQRMDSQIVGEGKDGNPRILDNPEYTESIKKAGLLGEELFLERWTQLPISDPISVECIFSINGKQQYVISECLSWVLDLLHQLGIIKSKSHRVVKSVNGSRFRSVKEGTCTLVILRRVE